MPPSSSDAKDLHPGRATASGTRAFHAQSGEADPRRFGDLTLSSIGLGTYLGADDDETDSQYAAAIARALSRGLNVLDTAINYRSQRSERVIGAVLHDLFARGAVTREQVMVTSKAGYVPFDGKRPRHYPAYIEDQYIRTGIIQKEDLAGGVHCMAPGYLADQIERSRRNLGLATIDVYHLHNPESGMEGVAPDSFLRRIRLAFEALEQAVSDGKIAAWGTATWHGYRKPPGTPPHHSLTEFLAIAREVGGPDHHFKIVQLPYNLGLIEAFASSTQEREGRLVPFLEVAAANGIYVTASAPLLQGQLVERLPDDLRRVLGFRTDAQRAVQFVRSTPGVGTALAGMKREAHVDELTEVIRSPVVAEEALRALFVE